MKVYLRLIGLPSFLGSCPCHLHVEHSLGALPGIEAGDSALDAPCCGQRPWLKLQRHATEKELDWVVPSVASKHLPVPARHMCELIQASVHTYISIYIYT